MERANPITNKTMFHANLVPATPFPLEMIVANVCENCNIKPIQLLNALYYLEKEIIKALQDGYSVRLGDIGSFHLRLSSVSVPSKEDFSAESLRGLKVRFIPNTRMKKELSLTNPKVVLVREDECDEERGKEKGQRLTVNEERLKVKGQRSMDNGQRTTVNGRQTTE